MTRNQKKVSSLIFFFVAVIFAAIYPFVDFKFSKLKGTNHVSSNDAISQTAQRMR